jgi:hypothetical protein
MTAKDFMAWVKEHEKPVPNAQVVTPLAKAEACCAGMSQDVAPNRFGEGGASELVHNRQKALYNQLVRRHGAFKATRTMEHAPGSAVTATKEESDKTGQSQVPGFLAHPP